MSNRKDIPTILILATVCCLSLLVILTTGCKKEADNDKPAVSTTAASKTAEFVNARCPIMDSPIDPAKVPENLTREHKGKKVAFCCAGCPVAWDKLSDAEKDAKLTKATQAKSD